MRISALSKSLWTPPAETTVRTMAKREYKDGENRKYKCSRIWYDEKGEWQAGYWVTYHWYVVLKHTLQDVDGGFRYTKSRETRVYFQTIAEAKRYIDEF